MLFEATADECIARGMGEFLALVAKLSQPVAPLNEVNSTLDFGFSE